MTKQKKSGTTDELPASALRWQCDPDSLGFETTDTVVKCFDIIGQKRALDALRLGFDIESQGYNIFVAGQVGTGRKSAINCLVNETTRLKNIPDDKLYVNNFKNPDKPRLIRMPASQGRGFKKDMDEFINHLLKTIPEIFESDVYQEKRKSVIDGFKNRQKQLVKQFEQEVAKEQFALVQMQVGMVTRPAVAPLVDGKPVNFEQLAAQVKEGKLTQEQLDKLEQKHAELAERMELVFKDIRGLEKSVNQDLKDLDHDHVTPLVKDRLEEIKQNYSCKQLDAYLAEIFENVLDNLDIFQKKSESSEASTPSTKVQQVDPFLEYRVNLLVDNFGAESAPVIYETSPTYTNLFGTVEVTPDRFGRTASDFTKIKAGSLLQADGGFLIIEALDLLVEQGVWPAFKRTLRNKKIEIQPFSPVFMISLSALKPEPIEVNVKVALVGDPNLYQMLYTRDEDFKKIFKLRADFNSEMSISKESINDYTSFIKRIIDSEKLKQFDKTAAAKIIEYGVTIAGRQSKLTTQFNRVADIIREANYWSQQDKSERVTAEHINLAIAEKRERKRMVEERIQEMIDEGKIIIDTDGTAIGQVNGLSVYDMGDYAFGKPSRITANTSVGTSGIINIEREAELSGRIHNKGVLILSGYLRQMFAQNKPLTLSASLCFEQSYGGVDGDSASSTEIYALLSALAGVPIKQGISVTGSVNQKGEIQPIGGVNQKIEGFFEVCQSQGLTGAQGVMIPHQNVNELMLREEVVEAVEKGLFHIYPVRTINQGIEILTGIYAGSQLEDGSFEKGSVFQLVDEKLLDFARKLKQFKGGKTT